MSKSPHFDKRHPGRASLLLRCVGCVLAIVLAAEDRADPSQPLENAAHRVQPDSPEWAELAGGLRRQTDIAADFTEERRFSFKKAPTVLRGEVRVSAERGLSLHYLSPAEQTVIIDGRGVLVRTAAGDNPAPADANARSVNEALLMALRLDLVSLARDFDVYGTHKGGAWTLALVPRKADLRHALGELTVEGDASAVRRLEFRRSATQRVDITVGRPRAPAPFTAEELRLYFR
jgi:hypothetical protein